MREVADLTPAVSHRPELQGLRALAVGLVLLFHIWPVAVPGGYIGVDVFFVISGYLIVGSLTRQAERDGKVSLLTFYGRRVRRLLPAASLVLAFAFAGTFLWLPQARWEDTFLQIAASALYFENWYLAWSSVDYLAADNAPSPVQHYWSLSIEEQFYLVWPLLTLGALSLAHWMKLGVRQILGIILTIAFLASFAFSVGLTLTNPGPAYFVSHARVWELALGGLLAMWLPSIRASDHIRACVFAAGLVAILLSAFLFDPVNVAFPGYIALLPTVGTGLIILAGDFRIGVFRGLNYAPLRYVGDISYSVYLWHWPLIVFFLAAGYSIGLWEGLALMALTIVVSHISYYFVEEWFRHPGGAVEARTVPFGLVSVAVLSGAAFLAVYSVQKQGGEGPVSEAGSYPGPAALVENIAVPAGIPLRPAPLRLLSDKASVYESGCHQTQSGEEAIVCQFGDTGASRRVAVVGSSHSVNWLPAIDILGQKNGWAVSSITKSSCSFGRRDLPACNKWHENVLEVLKNESVDVVIIGEISQSAVASEAAQQTIANRFKAIADLGIPIVTIRPTPHLETEPGDCLPDNIERCVIPRKQADKANSVNLAVATVPNVHLIDMNGLICAPDSCGPVVGNLVVFRDKHHLTRTYAVALAPYLESKLNRVLPDVLTVKGNVMPELGAAEMPHEAVLTCGALGSSPSFVRNYKLVLTGEKILLRRGDWQTQESGFEIWEGRVRREAVRISGEYMEGSKDIKSVELVGTLTDGRILAGGMRGPRACSLSWDVPTEAGRSAP